jgi:hypothetical protein
LTVYSAARQLFASRRGLIAATSQTINGRRIVVQKDIYLHRIMFLRRKEHK